MAIELLLSVDELVSVSDEWSIAYPVYSDQTWKNRVDVFGFVPYLSIRIVLGRVVWRLLLSCAPSWVAPKRLAVLGFGFRSAIPRLFSRVRLRDQAWSFWLFWMLCCFSCFLSPGAT